MNNTLLLRALYNNLTSPEENTIGHQSLLPVFVPYYHKKAIITHEDLLEQDLLSCFFPSLETHCALKVVYVIKPAQQPGRTIDHYLTNINFFCIFILWYYILTGAPILKTHAETGGHQFTCIYVCM